MKKTTSLKKADIQKASESTAVKILNVPIRLTGDDAEAFEKYLASRQSPYSSVPAKKCTVGRDVLMAGIRHLSP
ncbi:MAG: hypothetical protein ABI977_12945 [Acidobacteriota bacterium]